MEVHAKLYDIPTKYIVDRRKLNKKKTEMLYFDPSKASPHRVVSIAGDGSYLFHSIFSFLAKTHGLAVLYQMCYSWIYGYALEIAASIHLWRAWKSIMTSHFFLNLLQESIIFPNEYLSQREISCRKEVGRPSKVKKERPKNSDKSRSQSSKKLELFIVKIIFENKKST